jgi:hypothetical protein
VQRSQSERQAFPQKPCTISSSIICNLQNVKAGRALLEDVVHGPKSELRLKQRARVDTTADCRDVPGRISAGMTNQGSTSNHSVIANAEHAPESSQPVIPEVFQGRCKKVAELIELCSASCFDVFRQSYLAGAHASNKSGYGSNNSNVKHMHTSRDVDFRPFGGAEAEAPLG